MSLRVLCYHVVVDAENFERQLKHLKENYTVISLHDMQAHLKNGTPIPTKAVLITFDDGDHTVYNKAFPLLKKYNLPSVLFIISELVGTNKPFWWDEIVKSTNNANEVRKAKLVPNQERLHLLQELRRNGTGHTYPQLTVEQVKELNANGVTITNHSHSHPMFDKCAVDELVSDLQMSRDFFSKNELSGYNTFAYPNGNYDAQAEGVLVKAGIEFAFLFDHQINKAGMNPLRISRLSVNDNTPLWKFKFILSGWHSRLLPVIRQVHKLLS